MDISTFNKKLAEKITSATLFEKGDNIAGAVTTWIEISEMTLKASKDPSLEIAFRNMLITKTEEIVQHVKDLKMNLSAPAELPSIPQKVERIDDFTDDIPSISERKEPPSIIGKSPAKPQQPAPKVKEDSDLNNIPKGFTEIEPSKNFEIHTPHDPGIVQKRIEQAEKMDSFISPPTQESDDPNKEDTIPAEHIELDPVSEGGNIICFACGCEKNPRNSDVCSECGTKLNS